MGKWELVRLGDVLDYEQPTKYIVNSTNYSDAFSIPVLTAGQSFTLGYTDETDNIFSEGLPVIIFDDFTTAIKYVDFPFKVKSSAMKILKAQKAADIKYLYYFMSTIKTDTELHKRYWISQYSNLKISLPPLPVQQQIANVLDRVSTLIKKRKAQIAKLNLLVKSQFIEMFGDVSGDNMVELKDICSIITDGTHQPPKFISTGIPFLLVSNVVDNKLTFETDRFISREDYEALIKRTPLEVGDILLTTVGSYGNPAIVTSEREFCFQRHIAYLKPKQELVISAYLHAAFLSDFVKQQIDVKIKGIAQKTLNLSELKTIGVHLPPLPLQNRFAEFVRAVDKSKSAIQQGLEKLELLYKSLIQKCFCGEVF